MLRSRRFDRRRQRQRNQVSGAKLEHKNSHNSKIYEFALAKYNFIADHLHLYYNEQNNKSIYDIKLLQFKDPYFKHTTAEQGIENDDNDIENNIEEEEKINLKINQIQQQMNLFDNLKSFISSKLYLNNNNNSTQKQPNENNTLKSKEEILESRKDIFKDQITDEGELFNLNYLPKVQPRVEKRNNTDYPQWFNIDEEQDKINNNKLPLYGSVYFNNNLRYYHSQQQQGQSMHFNIQLNDELSYYKFDDYIQTSLLNFNTPRYLYINAQSNSVLSLLMVLKMLISIKSYSTLEIDLNRFNQVFANQDHSHENNESILKKKIIENIFQVITSQRNLQYLKLSLSKIYLEQVTNGMSQANLENSNIQYLEFYGTDFDQFGSQYLNPFFKQIVRLQQLCCFKSNQILINKDNIESFQNIMKKLSYADLDILRTQVKFDSPKLKKLILKYTFYSHLSTTLEYSNFLLCENLETLEICYNVINESTHLKTNNISRKQLLKEAQLIKKIKTQSNQTESQKIKKMKTVQESNEDIDHQIDEEGDDYNDEEILEEQDISENLKQNGDYDFNGFQELSSLQKLKKLTIKLDNKKDNFDDICQFLNKSNSIEYLKINIHHNRSYKGIESLFTHLNESKSLRKFNLDYSCNSISYYQQCKTLNTYTLDLTFRENYDTYKSMKLIKFAFDKVNRIRIYADQIPFKFYLDILNSITTSIRNCQKIQSIKIELNCSYDKINLIEANKLRNQSLKFFACLSQLNNLEIVDVQLPCNQDIIDSLSVLMENSKSLKAFQFTRERLRQFYLDYSKLFKSISISPSIEQISLNLSIENMEIRNPQNLTLWELTKNNNYYNPFCEMLINSQINLKLIEIFENYKEKEIIEILNAILYMNHHKYIKFNQSTLDKILSQQQIIKENENNNNNNIQELGNKVYNKGYLVSSKFQFQLFRNFHSNYNRSQRNYINLSRSLSRSYRSSFSSSNTDFDSDDSDSF